MWKTTTKNTLPQPLRLTDPSVREQLEALPASVLLIGLGTGGQPVRVDLGNESPHILVSTISGGGATTTLRTLTAQLLHHGAHALILDPEAPPRRLLAPSSGALQPWWRCPANERRSVAFGGAVGSSWSAICCSVTARRSKSIRVPGASTAAKAATSSASTAGPSGSPGRPRAARCGSSGAIVGDRFRADLCAFAQGVPRYAAGAAGHAEQ
ncbi:hypothetical protein [Streptomyces mirabilis]|jgi:hypothetical protein|uniref:hypothetical protein n=1 Tax=Streptomyces mirabilis TaxID=68239 RepID=UPI000A5E2DD4